MKNWWISLCVLGSVHWKAPRYQRRSDRAPTISTKGLCFIRRQEDRHLCQFYWYVIQINCCGIVTSWPLKCALKRDDHNARTKFPTKKKKEENTIVKTHGAWFILVMSQRVCALFFDCLRNNSSLIARVEGCSSPEREHNPKVGHWHATLWF